MSILFLHFSLLFVHRIGLFVAFGVIIATLTIAAVISAAVAVNVPVEKPCDR